jgi:uncharacterized protein YkwD
VEAKMRTKRVLSGILAATVLSALAPSTIATASSGRSTNHSKCWKSKESEREFARKINTARNRNSKGRLKLDPELSKAARSHTFGMANKDLLYHTPGDRLTSKVTNWSTLGENVGVGNWVGELHNAFMASHGHRDNILYSGFTHVGIGVVVRNDRMWVTVIFEGRTDPGTTLRMPRC